MHQKALAWDKTARFQRRCLVFEIEAFSPKVRAMEMALHWCCADPTLCGAVRAPRRSTQSVTHNRTMPCENYRQSFTLDTVFE